MGLLNNKRNDIYILKVDLPRTSIYLANDFKDMLFKAIDEGEKKLIVDFSACDFVDSTFLGVLVISHKKLIEIGGNIKIVVNNPNIIASIEMTRMNKIFEVYKSLDEAIQSYNS